MPNIRGGAIVAVALATMSTGASSSTPLQLNCTLADVAAQPGSKNRPVVIIFDPAAKTLVAREGQQSYRFANVSISNIAISGDVGDISIGVDRSSLGIVWQQYRMGKAATQFGQCQAAAAATDNY